MNILVGLSTLLVVVFLLLYFLVPETLIIPYTYFGVLFIAMFIPIVVELFRHPKFLPKLLTIVVYCFFFALFYETVALKTGIWAFPGNEYVGIISLFGVQFPFEEFFFFVLLFPIGILAYYKLFDGDEK